MAKVLKACIEPLDILLCENSSISYASSNYCRINVMNIVLSVAKHRFVFIS